MIKKRTPTYISWIDSTGDAQTLYFDLVIQDEPTHSSEITKFPVEQGAMIADHIRVQPVVLTGSFMVSDTPIEDFPDGSRTKQVSQIKLSVPAGAHDRAVVAQFFDGEYIAGTYATLRQLHDDHILMTVTTPVKNYDNMAITKLSMPRDKDFSGDAGKFDLEWEQITIVSSDIVSSAVLPESKPTANKGNVDTQVADPADQTTVLYDLANGGSSSLPDFLAKALNVVK